MPDPLGEFIAGLGGYLQPITIRTYRYALMRLQDLMDVPLDMATLIEQAKEKEWR